RQQSAIALALARQWAEQLRYSNSPEPAAVPVAVAKRHANARLLVRKPSAQAQPPRSSNIADALARPSRNVFCHGKPSAVVLRYVLTRAKPSFRLRNSEVFHLIPADRSTLSSSHRIRRRAPSRSHVHSLPSSGPAPDRSRL